MSKLGENDESREATVEERRFLSDYIKKFNTSTANSDDEFLLDLPPFHEYSESDLVTVESYPSSKSDIAPTLVVLHFLNGSKQHQEFYLSEILDAEKSYSEFKARYLDFVKPLS